MGEPSRESFALRLRRAMDQFTPSERQLAATLLADYPAAGLQSSVRLAEIAGVSTPTIVRMARKLGYDGFTAMQEVMRREVSEQVKKPASKHAEWHARGSDRHTVNQFGDLVSANLRTTLDALDLSTFDQVAALLSDTQRSVLIAGGRITRTLADHLHNHLHILRPGVSQMGTSAHLWPHALLDLGPGSILILFDIRRYQSDYPLIAELAQKRGAEIVLFTDQWGSPVSSHANHVFAANVEALTSWDSTMALMFLVEALIADVSNRLWSVSRKRVDELEDMFDCLGTFGGGHDNGGA
ncbi:MAG: MurR/RpiR family transcriptional regulator [Fulvimarina manganoxydans]|uniref:MurR/RpiR family transcriptional regulator n=1 Tax=Fulvimarina manganoxydans TaxID=937218 RepID=UPI002353A9A0|nr:MurR/RpiR family transcriptional regulator [Fulvimarina manganoxydans]MCK5934783.1 MurR/RpiR family transcriptional regulator [Fulvimarina manganoxydans]